MDRETGWYVWGWRDPGNGEMRFISYGRTRPSPSRLVQAGAEPAKLDWVMELRSVGLEPERVCLGEYDDYVRCVEAYCSALRRYASLGQCELNFTGERRKRRKVMYDFGREAVFRSPSAQPVALPVARPADDDDAI